MSTRFRQALVIALGIGLAGVLVALGFWQLEVYHHQGAAAAAERAAAPPIPLSSVARPTGSAFEGYGRSVVFDGTVSYEVRKYELIVDVSAKICGVTPSKVPAANNEPIVNSFSGIISQILLST